jgi:hypothetical protein
MSGVTKREKPPMPIGTSATALGKVAVYKYHTNKFVYKNEGVGAIADCRGQTDDVKVLKKGRFHMVAGKIQLNVIKQTPPKIKF